jgi:uncharacterized protein (TIGR02646 family)
MRAIDKGGEPRLWTEHCATPGAVYDGRVGPGPTAEAMAALRRALVQEQGYLCCYCMGRILPTEHDMKVEHFHPRSTHPEEQLRYRNLLGACLGGAGSRRAAQHCDAARGNALLHVDPADPIRNCTPLFRYLANGEIDSVDAGAKADIEILNLNVEKLRLNRKAVLDGLREWSERRRSRGRALTKGELHSKSASWRQMDRDGMARPMCEVALYWLARRACRRA